MRRTQLAEGTSHGWLNLLLLGFPAVLTLLLLVGCGRSPDTADKESGIAYKGTELAGAAADLRLVSQRGEDVALSDFRGKVVVLAFLDPDCTDVCPLTAIQFRLTAEALGNDASAVVFLAVNVNPKLNSVADVAGATEKWGVAHLTNWYYLTGSREELEPVYQAYNIAAEGPPKPDKPTELAHTPGVYVLDQAGQKRWYVSTAFDPSISLSELLVEHIRKLLR